MAGWWFAPRATAALTRAFFARRRSGRGWFLFGGWLFWLVVIYVVAAAYLLVVAAWMLAVCAVWTAQLAVALVAALGWAGSSTARAIAARRARRQVTA